MNSINDCDYLVIDVNTITVDDELIVEIDFTFNFSAYNINKAKLLYGISIPASKRISIREWNTYACNIENVLLEIPDHCLVSGYMSFNDMSQWLLTYSESKPILKLVDDDKFSIDLLTVMKIASTNIESINMVKKFHHNRLMKMIDENDYDEDLEHVYDGYTTNNQGENQ